MEKVVYKVGKFTDFAGFEREVVLCAVSQSFEGETKGSSWVENYENGYITNFIYGRVSSTLPVYKQTPSDNLTKVLRLGISVQNPMDKPNTELGKTIALGKAKKDKSCFGKIYSTKSGFINQKMVEALLEQELEYFQNSPQVYIKGYNKDKELFEKNPNSYYEKYKLPQKLTFHATFK